MRLSKQELFNLMKQKLIKAGLNEEAASDVSDVLTFADHRGIHSHGAVRVEYYAERIAKGGITADPDYTFEKTGPATATFDGDNGPGHQAAKQAMEEAIEMARDNGVAVVGVKNISHSGALGYFVEMAAKEDMVAISMCQSDPMVVPLVELSHISEQIQLHLVHHQMMIVLLLLIWQRLYKLGGKY